MTRQTPSAGHCLVNNAKFSLRENLSQEDAEERQAVAAIVTMESDCARMLAVAWRPRVDFR